MRTAVITIAAHRTAQLRNQVAGLTMSHRTPDDHVVVSMGDPDIVDACLGLPVHCLWMRPRTALPLAEARNLGARRAIARDAELLVFLDVDCIPSPQLVARYHTAAMHERGRPALLCGPVTYLPPPPRAGYDLNNLAAQRDPHPARPDPADGEILDSDDFELFWGLSYAVTADTWRRTGGFCPQYRGYGGEDTDFAEQAAATGVGLRWVGGADAYHQYHPVSDPPTEHLDDILANATIFHRRWSRWPMRGWLDDFADAGLIRYNSVTDQWQRTYQHSNGIEGNPTRNGVFPAR